MKYFCFIICFITLFASCKDKDEKDNLIDKIIDKRTIIAYISAENNLSSYSSGDINEMLKGSLNIPNNMNLIAFVDVADPSMPPYVINIKDGKSTIDTDITFSEDFYASDPNKMRDILNRIMLKYPAESFGLILWGHANGWIINNSSIDFTSKRRAYGGDNGNNSTSGSGKVWMNIPDMAKALESLPQKFNFIFADCCNFQCAEIAYELRNATDLIIGSPAEIPGYGAPYDKIIPLLFDTSNNFYEKVVDAYFNDYYTADYDESVPLSVINTQNIDKLAEATRKLVPELMPKIEFDSLVYYIKTDSLVYYYDNNTKVMFDAKGLINTNVTDSNKIAEWIEALNETVVYKKRCSRWMTSGLVDFSDFNVTEDNYSGITMFVPLPEYDRKGKNYNKAIEKMQWWTATEMNKFYIKE